LSKYLSSYFKKEFPSGYFTLIIKELSQQIICSVSTLNIVTLEIYDMEILPINQIQNKNRYFENIAQINKSFQPRVNIHADFHYSISPFPVFLPLPPCHRTHQQITKSLKLSILRILLYMRYNYNAIFNIIN